MILSLDTEWVLIPSTTRSSDSNKFNDYQCPVIKQVSAVTQNSNGGSVNLSLHLFLSTLRHRCIERLNHSRGIPEFESLRTHLSNFVFSDKYPSIGKPIPLIPELDGMREMFSNLDFVD
jgi:hypothetical protein